LPVSLAPGFFEGKGNKNGFQVAEGLSQYSRPDTMPSYIREAVKKELKILKKAS